MERQRTGDEGGVGVGDRETEEAESGFLESWFWQLEIC